MRKRNKRILQLNLNMLNKAINMDFMECMAYEHKIMMALAESGKIFAKFSKGFTLADDFSVQEIEEKAMAKRPDGADKYQLTFKHEKDSILPSSRYFRRYSDCFRSYFNQTEVRDQRLREGYEQSVKVSLLRMGIDPVSPTFDRDIVRARIRDFNDCAFLHKVKFERLMEIYDSPALRKGYFDTRRKEIDRLLGKEGQ